MKQNLSRKCMSKCTSIATAMIQLSTHSDAIASLHQFSPNIKDISLSQDQ